MPYHAPHPLSTAALHSCFLPGLLQLEKCHKTGWHRQKVGEVTHAKSPPPVTWHVILQQLLLTASTCFWSLCILLQLKSVRSNKWGKYKRMQSTFCPCCMLDFSEEQNRLKIFIHNLPKCTHHPIKWFNLFILSRFLTFFFFFWLISEDASAMNMFFDNGSKNREKSTIIFLKIVEPKDVITVLP